MTAFSPGDALTRVAQKFGLLTCGLPWLLLLAASAQADMSVERYDCLIEPQVVVDVGTPVQGIIGSLTAERGDVVKAGQVVARLESSVEKASLRQARLRAAMAGEVQAHKADLALAVGNLKRTMELIEKNMVTPKAHDESHVQYKLAESALQAAEEKQQLYRREADWAQEVLSRRTIRSPIDGVVVMRHVHPGEFVYENPIVQIAQLDPLRVEVVLPSDLYGQVRKGMRATVYPELGGAPLLTEVKLVDGLIDTGSSTFGVQVEIDNADRHIIAGQKCEIAFSLQADDGTEQAATESTVDARGLDGALGRG